VQQRPQDIQNLLKSLFEAKADFDNNTFEDIAIMSSKSDLSKEQILEGMNKLMSWI
jgi:NitT/TauT family transport system substrate-binding protein